jgi:hypothetical protein
MPPLHHRRCCCALVATCVCTCRCMSYALLLLPCIQHVLHKHHQAMPYCHGYTPLFPDLYTLLGCNQGARPSTRQGPLSSPPALVCGPCAWGRLPFEKANCIMHLAVHTADMTVGGVDGEDEV